MFATASHSGFGSSLGTTTTNVVVTTQQQQHTATSLMAMFRDNPTNPPDESGNDSSSSSEDDRITLQIYALQQILYQCCPSHEWSMIVSILPDLEALAEECDASSSSSQRLMRSQLAAAIASQVFFYLEEPASALRLALAAGPYGPQWTSSSTTNSNNNTVTRAATAPTKDDPYVTTLVRAALEAYIQIRQAEWDQESKPPPSHDTTTATTKAEELLLLPTWNVAQLQPIIDAILETTLSHAAAHPLTNYRYAIGICYDARDMAKLRFVLQHALDYYYIQPPNDNSNNNIQSIRSLLQYTRQCVMDHTLQQQSDRTLSQLALTTLATFWKQLLDHGKDDDDNDGLVVVHDLVRTYHDLQDANPVAAAMRDLLIPTNHTTPQQQEELRHLTVLQMAFDLVDTGDQTFCQQVADRLRAARPERPAVDPNETTPVTTTHVDIWDRVDHVLVGGFVAELRLSFRHRHAASDDKMMEGLKQKMDDRSSGSHRNSMLHTTAMVTHAYLYAGTTHDTFLRNHLDWMKKASHWAKFTATASLGVIHADHVTEAMQLLEPYLPADPEDGGNPLPTGGFAEGGSLYALGLIHGSSGMTNTDKRRDAAAFCRKHLRASHVNDAISHGACLAVGLTCFGSMDPQVVLELKSVLDTDFAVAGEAAGLAIGMVLVGTGAGNVQNALPDSTRDELMDIVSELKNYARETQHEKIIRGIAMGIAIMNFGQQDNADATIEEMRTDRDPIMRYGAQYAIALAYCGTGSNKAVRILLHTAVSDVSDDVRMAAVIGLAFVLFKTPERVPQLVKLLLESFNPHVRYASCMAVGIAMAGTGDSESIALLEPMLDDMTDYVRQGALMGTAMIYMQQSDTSNGRKIRSFRDKLSALISEKHQSTLTKMGAILSIGIIDAGGRNCALQLGSRTGFTKMTSAVGLALWLQHWHWFPMMHMFSLALTPTLTIGLNKDLKYPKTFEIICNSKPSQFAFPKKLQEKKEKVKKHVETFTLSTTAKEKARLARKKAKEEKETMDEGEDAKNPADDNEEKSGDAMDVDKEGDEEVDEEEKPRKKREPEPLSFLIANPARVTKAQSQYCSFDPKQRYRPVRSDESPSGVIMLYDCSPDEEEYIGTVKSPSLEPLGELAPPEPFEWIAPTLPVEDEEEDEEGDEGKDAPEASK